MKREDYEDSRKVKLLEYRGMYISTYPGPGVFGQWQSFYDFVFIQRCGAFEIKQSDAVKV